MDARVADQGLAIPARQFDEPDASPNQKAEMLALGLLDSRLADRLGKWQANTVLDQLRAERLAEREAQNAAQRRRRQGRAAEVLFLLLGMSSIAYALWSWPHA